MSILPRLDDLLACLLPTLDACRLQLLSPSPVESWFKYSRAGRPEVVSALDHTIEQLLVSCLRRHFPAIPILAEESQHNWTALCGEACFVIDPIDGTREFLAGRDGYSISIALLQHGSPVLAILDFPARGQRFWASRGHGVYRDGVSTRVAFLSPAGTLQLLAVSPSQTLTFPLAVLQSALPGFRLIPHGAMAAKLAGVACGTFHAAAFLAAPGARAPIWDFAAAALILAEAGGDFIDLRGRPLLHSLPPVLLHGWLATNGQPPEMLLSALAECSSSLSALPVQSA
jgi:fructose-1,6-bisphosphatase/inositol monophosphatase family enzyme